MIRRMIAACFAAVLATSAAPALADDGYPSRPVRLVVPYPAGGSLDAISRIVAQDLSERLGQSFIVENRGGAGGTLGTAAVAQAEPDGYTLLMVVDSHAINPSIFPNLTYETERDLQPVVLIGRAPLILVVPKSSPATTVADLVRVAREKPGTVSLGTLGRGSQPDLAGHLFATRAQVQFVEVPYAGGGAVVKDIVSAQIQATFLTQGSIASLIQAGDLKPLGVTSAERTSLFPNVPTMKEAGYDFTSEYWFGMVAPARVSAEIVQKVEAAMLSIMASPQFKQRLLTIGVVVTPMNRREFGAYISSERKKWAEVIAEMKR